MHDFNPEQALCETRREFGEHGGVTPSISRSSTFTAKISAAATSPGPAISGPPPSTATGAATGSAPSAATWSWCLPRCCQAVLLPMR